MSTIGQTRVTLAFVSVSDAADILGMTKSNVAKMLERRQIPFQTLTVGKSEMRVYLRTDVERVMQERAEKAAAKVSPK